MTDADVEGMEDDANPLLTPRERAARRTVRALRSRSEQLIRESQRLARPKEFLHRFPQPAPPSGAPPAKRQE